MWKGISRNYLFIQQRIKEMDQIPCSEEEFVYKLSDFFLVYLFVSEFSVALVHWLGLHYCLVVRWSLSSGFQGFVAVLMTNCWPCVGFCDFVGLSFTHIARMICLLFIMETFKLDSISTNHPDSIFIFLFDYS